MKYLKLFGLAALAMAFTACDDIEESSSLPQTNPQLPGVDIANITVAKGADASAISLTAFNDANKQIELATVATPTDWPEGYEVSVPFVEVSPTDDFAKYFDIDATMGAEGAVLVSPDAMQGKWVEFFGKNPKAREVYMRFPVCAVKDNQVIRMGSATTFFGQYMTTVTPFDTFGYTIEDTYYVVGSFCNWDVAQGIKMKHSEYDPYDDTTFSAVIDVTGAGYEFAIIPESTKAAGNLTAGGWGGEYEGIVAVIDKSAHLVAAEAGKKPNAIVVDEVGAFTVALNFANLTYTVTELPRLFTPGDANGWSQAASQTLTSTNGYEFKGFAHLKGAFKFTSQANWDGTNYGAGAEEGTLTTDGSAGNITVAEDNLYWCYVVTEVPDDASAAMQAKAMTYTLTPIATLGVIGDLNGWAAQDNLTPSADFLTWSGVVEFKGGGSWKFRMDDNWDINLGGNLDDLSVDGANIADPGAGKYLVTLNLATRPYTCTLTPQ